MLNIEANYGKYYVYILIGLFIGFITLPENVYILFYVVFITLLLFLIVSFYKKSIVILYIILILIYLQDFIAVLFSTKINSNTIYLFVLYKELLVYILLLSTFILIINNYSKISKLDFLIVVYMFITLFYFFLSPQLIQAKLLSARQFILPFILVLF
ncbi:hypothetical protein, partial [Niallia circulans]|uniref:hypothetical protein n=1 Tax=Niallia circulans TaxID=1397 RepID=UPI001C27087B